MAMLGHLWCFVAYILLTKNGVLAAEGPFSWLWPPPWGLDPKTMSVAPCGGFSDSHDRVTNVIDQLRWNQSEPRIKYMTRIAQNISTSTPSGWTPLYPEIQAELDKKSSDENPAQFCVHLDKPQGFIPNETVFQLIASTPLGIIFACSKVSFVTLTNQTKSYPQTCDFTHGNGTITNVTDPDLASAALLGPGQTATLASSTSLNATKPTSNPQLSSPLPCHNCGRHMSKGAIAGTVIGGVAGFVAFVALFLSLLRRRRASRKAALERKKFGSAGETSGSDNGLALGDQGPRLRTSELPAGEIPWEADSSPVMEMGGSGEKMPRLELPSPTGPTYPDEKKKLKALMEERGDEKTSEDFEKQEEKLDKGKGPLDVGF